MAALTEYFEALNRLKNNCPIRVPKGSSVNNDTVALEAGRMRGSIKKSRESFKELITDIESAAKIQEEKESNGLAHQLEKRKSEKAHYRRLYHEALNRELMLLERLAYFEKQVKVIKSVG